MALFAAAVVSCSRDRGPEETKWKNPYAFVGQLHNEGLDYVFEYLKANKEGLRTRSGEAPARELRDMCLAGTEAFMASKGLQGLYDVRTRSGDDPSWLPADSLDLTPRGAYYYDLLMTTIHNENNDRDQIVSAIESLEVTMTGDATLDAGDLEALLCGTATAVYSIDYWSENSQAWGAEFGSGAWALDPGGENSTMAVNPGRVSGHVRDEYNEPVIGCTVSVEDTRYCVVADINGCYSISVPPGSPRLVFEFIGYETQKVGVEGRSIIDVVMAVDNPWTWGRILNVAGHDVAGAISGSRSGGWPGAVAMGALSSAEAAGWI